MSGKTGNKLSKVRTKANVKGRGAIMATKLIQKLAREKA